MFVEFLDIILAIFYSLQLITFIIVTIFIVVSCFSKSFLLLQKFTNFANRVDTVLPYNYNIIIYVAIWANHVKT